MMNFNGFEFQLVTERNSEVRLTHHKDYKLEGIDSINTSVLSNPYCHARQNCVGSVCEYCYAQAQLSCYKSQREMYEKNTELLTSEIITNIILWSTMFGRIESFGDLQNETHAINYLNQIRFNPHVRFAWWTKNPEFIAQAIEDGWTKPDNVVILYSSLMRNKQENIEDIKKKYPFIDKVFTVYDSEEDANKAGVTINCGGNKCMTCPNSCYKKNDVVYVNEIRKQHGFGSFKNRKDGE